MPIITKTEYVKIVGAADTTPDNFVDFTDATGQAANTVITSNSQTITGITSANVSVSGDGSPEVSINGATFTSSPGTINNNQTIAVRLTSATGNNFTRTATVTIGTVSKTFDVITGAAGGTGSGTSGGSSGYGVEVYDTNGTTTVLSPSTRYLNFMNPDQTTVTVPARVNSTNGTVFVQQDMSGLTTSNSAVVFTDFFSGSYSITVTRNTTGAVSTQGITLSNSATTAVTLTPFIVRF